MAEKLLCNNVTDLWKDVRVINKGKTFLTCTIEGVSGADNIAELWRKHYSAVFNCVESNPYKVRRIANNDKFGITTREVYEVLCLRQ